MKRAWRKLILAAGDGDFHEVAQHLVENEGVTLILVGTLDSISQELRPYASAFFEIDKEASTVLRPKSTSAVQGAI
jgi:uncharacterized LabA/DUF88 family protein